LTINYYIYREAHVSRSKKKCATDRKKKYNDVANN